MTALYFYPAGRCTFRPPFTTGDDLMLQVEVANLGEAGVPADTGITISVQLSPDSVWDAEHSIILDVPETWLHTSGLGTEATFTFDLAALPIPINALPGSYHLGVRVQAVDPLDEADAANNLWWSPQADVTIIGAFVDVGLFRLFSEEGFAQVGPDGQMEAVSSITHVGLIPDAGESYAPLVRVEGDLVFNQESIIASGVLHAAELNLPAPIWLGTVVWTLDEAESQSLFLQGLLGDLVSPAGLPLSPEAITMSPDGLLLSGQLALPSLLGSQMLSLDSDQALLITPDGMRLAGLAATLTAGPFDIGVGWRLNEIELTYDWFTNAFRGGASLTTPGDLTIEGFIELLNGAVDGIGFDLQGLDRELPRVPKLRLTRLAGGVQNLQNAQPLLISAGLGFVSGPTVTLHLPDWAGGTFHGSLMTASLDGELDVNHIAATGELSLKGGLVTGEGGFLLDWDTGNLNLDATFSILAGIVQTTANLRANSDLDLSLNAAASVQFPAMLPIIGGRTIASGNVYLQYRDGAPPVNSFITAWTEVDLPFNQSIVGGFQVHLDGSWQLIGAEELEQAQQQIQNSARFGNPLGLTVSQSSGELVTNFAVPDGAPFALFEVRWANPADWQDLGLAMAAPHGDPLELATLLAQQGVAVVEDFSDDTRLVLMVDAPSPGAWQLTVQPDETVGEVEARGLSPLTVPTITLDGPIPTAGLPHEATFNFEVDDAPGGSAVHLYYDQIGAGFEGVLLAGDLPVMGGSGTFTWDTSALPDGKYHVYAVVIAPGQTPAFSNYSDAVMVPPVDDTPPLVNVTIGDATIGSLTYTDPAGNGVTVQLRGGAAELYFTGSDITLDTKGNKAVVTSGPTTLHQIVLSDTDARSRLQIKANGGTAAEIGSIIGSTPLGQLQAKGVDLVGEGIVMTDQGTISKLQFDNLQNGADIVMPGAGNGGGIQMTVISIGAGSTLDLGEGLRQLRASGAVAGTIMVPWVQQIRAADLGIDLIVSEDVQKVQANVLLDGTWNVGGDVQQIRADRSLEGWNLDVQGELGQLGLTNDSHVALTGGVLSRLQANASVSGHFDLQSIDRFSVKGWLDDATLRTTGDVGQLQVGGLRSTTLLVGVDTDLDEAPTDRGGFTSQSRIEQLQIKGMKGSNEPSLIDAHIAAFEMGKVQLGNTEPSPGNTATGSLVTTQVDSYQRDRFRLKDVSPNTVADPANIFDTLNGWTARLR